MSDFKFTAEDFNHVWAMPEQMNATGAMASIANAKLREWIDAAPVVYGRPPHHQDSWGASLTELDTRVARIICIEPIVKETKPRDSLIEAIEKLIDCMKKISSQDKEWNGPTNEEISRAMRPGQGED